MLTARTPPPGGGITSKNTKTFDITVLIQKLNDLEALCRELKDENEKLKLENRSFTSAYASKQTNNEVKVTYETDEEELALETDWILKKNKRPNKKRKAEGSPVYLVSDKHTVNDPPVFEISAAKNGNQKYEPRPPPIMVSNITNYQKLSIAIENLIKNPFTLKLLNNDIYKINVTHSDDYRSVTKMLTESEISWFSYQNKQTRPIKVMIKNLHHTCEPEAIIADLNDQGFNVLNAVNKLKWKSKEPLNMFMVTFDPSEDINKIYKINHVLHSIVVIEPVKASNLIPQCKSCQAFGHTKNYCNKTPRCVKCSGKHSTFECKKPSDQNPKCCNCGENHPANYRGCIVAKELQKIRDKNRNKNRNKQQMPNHSNKVIDTINKVTKINAVKTKKPSFAEILKEDKKIAISNKITNNDQILAQILLKLNNQEDFNKSLHKRLNDLEKQILSKGNKHND